MVDDDPDDIFITKALCKRASVPIEFMGLSSGDALFEFIKNNGVDPIDLILLDVLMPKDSGYDVLNKMRASPLTADVTIVMFSGVSHPHQKKLALDLGANDFLLKPVSAEQEKIFFDLLSERHRHCKTGK